MTQKIIIDLGQRTMGGFRLRWNRLTPTRWGKTTGESISNASRQGPVTVSIGDQLIISDSKGTFPVFRSDAYAANLKRAGITQIPVPQNETRDSVRKTFDTLIDKGPEEAKADLEARGFQVEIKPSTITGFFHAFREFRSVHPISGRQHKFFTNEHENGKAIMSFGSLIGSGLGIIGVLATSVFNIVEWNNVLAAVVITGGVGGGIGGFIVGLTVHLVMATLSAMGLVKRAVRNFSDFVSLKPQIDRANDPSTIADELLRLSEHSLSYVRMAVARNSNLPIPILVNLVGDVDPRVRAVADSAVSTNTNVAKEIELVNDPSTSAAELLRLSRHPLTYIKIALASQRASEDAHTVLANDDSIAVKTALAANPWITDRVVDRLSIDVSLDSFWELLARNWAASPEKVAWLINAKIKMSNPEVPYRAAVEGGTYEIVHCTGTYGEEGQIEIIVVEPVPEQEYSPASYSAGDYSKAASIINSHLIEKRQQILAELRLLNPELAAGILEYLAKGMEG